MEYTRDIATCYQRTKNGCQYLNHAILSVYECRQSFSTLPGKPYSDKELLIDHKSEPFICVLPSNVHSAASERLFWDYELRVIKINRLFLTYLQKVKLKGKGGMTLTPSSSKTNLFLFQDHGHQYTPCQTCTGGIQTNCLLRTKTIHFSTLE